ncbi:MAG: agmatine deiminase family protein [Pseudomonadota bacterium]
MSLIIAAPMAMADDEMRSKHNARELIVVAAPAGDDPYYVEARDAIIAFHLGFAAAAEGRDDFLVLADRVAYATYEAALGAERVALAPQADIWARDFSPANAHHPVRFAYTAEGQGGGRRGRADAQYVQSRFDAVLRKAGVAAQNATLLNDGGNFVEDGAGRAVLSRKFLRDNRMDEAEARAALRSAIDLQHVAFIEADEQGGLEHADGVVAFIAPNVLVINAYPDDPDYAADLRADLMDGLPGVTIHELPIGPDVAETLDARFGSACGLYTNMLVTPDRIYLPQFGVAEDEIARSRLAEWSEKEVVPVDASGVCHMGGGVRCMAAQFRGDAAARLAQWAERPGGAP